MRYMRLTENLLVSAILICLIALFAVNERLQEWMRKKSLPSGGPVMFNRVH